MMEAGREVTIHTDYTLHGDEHNIAMSYKKLPNDVAPGAEVSQSSRLKYPVLLTKTARSVPTLTDPPLPRNTRQILIGDGSIVMVVLSCHPENGTVRCRCANTAMLGERKNVRPTSASSSTFRQSPRRIATTSWVGACPTASISSPRRSCARVAT